jgi:glycosyltransferase involved in cell wall biosynthesis
MTLGDLYPHLLALPGGSHIAAIAVGEDHRVAPAVLAPCPRVVVRGIGDSSTGYGQMVAHLVEQLDAEGIAVHFENLHHDEARRPMDDRLKSRLLAPIQHGPVVLMGGPATQFPPGSIILSMWEATLIPAHAVANMNQARAVIVPCDDNARWFKDSGVTVPIRVVPLGIDPAVHHPGGRAAHQGFVVGAAGRVGPGGGRKGLHLVIAAFLEAFPDDEDVTLEIKCYEDCAIEDYDHPRIKFVRRAMTDAELADWYRGLDLFASASKGEGWGLQPHQSMACGTPVAAAWWGGHAHYMTEASTWAVEFDEEIAGAPYYTGSARWCAVKHDSLVGRMLEAHRDPEGRKAKGLAAAEQAAQFDWARSGRELSGVIREFGLDCPPAPPAVDPRVRDAVRACPNRGPEGGLVLLDEERGCCGGGAERTECRAGKGSRPGRVSLRECLACKT